MKFDSKKPKFKEGDLVTYRGVRCVIEECVGSSSYHLRAITPALYSHVTSDNIKLTFDTDKLPKFKVGDFVSNKGKKIPLRIVTVNYDDGYFHYGLAWGGFVGSNIEENLNLIADPRIEEREDNNAKA